MTFDNRDVFCGGTLRGLSGAEAIEGVDDAAYFAGVQRPAESVCAGNRGA
ncbi:MAG: hypothetical protein JO192_00490, partial [Candidatus Eremiobacteraeota bacterium]|nr:hypothetical protein [Candidatus Eremiobacteraeota bacterium]